MTLLDDIRQLEAAVYDQSPGLNTVIGLMSRVREQIRRHMLEEEQRLFPMLLRRNVTSGTAVEVLTLEHLKLQDDLDVLLGRLEDQPALTPALKLRATVDTWLRNLRDHEFREMEMMQEAYLRDVGSSE